LAVEVVKPDADASSFGQNGVLASVSARVRRYRLLKPPAYPCAERSLEVPAIDRIEINDNGTSKTISPAEWKAIPVVERVRLLRGLASFFAGGVEVPAKVALAELK
jgi:hypothetical protein